MAARYNSSNGTNEKTAIEDGKKGMRKENGDSMPQERCFVVTPIGGEGEPIRRHIDGIIQAAIKPVLESCGYKVIAAHTMSESGSIDKQIFKEIYEDKLVIANLTQNNPNVMYELAVRHCFGKPVIIIAEEGSNLPFDILRERTIFYVNDGLGILKLQDKLRKAIESIDFEKQDSPIHNIIQGIKKDAKVYADIESGNVSASSGITDREVMVHILEKLEAMDIKIQRSIQSQSEIENSTIYYRYYCEFWVKYPAETNEPWIEIRKRIINEIEMYFGFIRRIDTDLNMGRFSVEFISSDNKSKPTLKREMTELLERFGFKEIECIEMKRKIGG